MFHVVPEMSGSPANLYCDPHPPYRDSCAHLHGTSHFHMSVDIFFIWTEIWRRTVTCSLVVRIINFIHTSITRKETKHFFLIINTKICLGCVKEENVLLFYMQIKKSNTHNKNTSKKNIAIHTIYIYKQNKQTVCGLHQFQVGICFGVSNANTS